MLLNLKDGDLCDRCGPVVDNEKITGLHAIGDSNVEVDHSPCGYE